MKRQRGRTASHLKCHAENAGLSCLTRFSGTLVTAFVFVAAPRSLSEGVDQSGSSCQEALACQAQRHNAIMTSPVGAQSLGTGAVLVRIQVALPGGAVQHCCFPTFSCPVAAHSACTLVTSSRRAFSFSGHHDQLEEAGTVRVVAALHLRL